MKTQQTETYRLVNEVKKPFLVRLKEWWMDIRNPDTYRFTNEIKPSYLSRLKEWWTRNNLGDMLLGMVVFVIIITVIVGGIQSCYSDYNNHHMAEKISKSMLIDHGYHDYKIMSHRRVGYTAGSGCLEMDREIEFIAFDKNKNQHEITFCCNGDACRVYKTHQIDNKGF